MKEYLLSALQTDGLAPKLIAVRLLAAAVTACFIFISYRLSHNSGIYSKKFNVSLAALTIITATVMIVIGNNLALSLGMVGALSIVRFRTAIKDSRDTVYIFWTVVAGICCGAGDYVAAGIGSSFIFILLLLFGRIRNDNRMLLIVRAARVNEEKIQSLIFSRFERKADLRVKNTTEDSVEFIYEISKKQMEKADRAEKSVTDEIHALGGVDYCNVVTQNDEVSG